MNHDPEDHASADEFDMNEGDSSFQMKIALPTDGGGYTGRECPNPECEGYFKVIFGTGLAGVSECYCPYCGHRAQGNQFFTKEQVEFIHSAALRGVTAELLAKLKKHEFNYSPRGPFGIGISLKVNGTLPPLSHYREKQLETEMVCNNCTLHYAIYGVFAYCPDCGIHNSLQILEKNLELAEKEAALASQVEGELATKLIEDALENEVSSFDGFGRETCRVHAGRATDPAKVENLSFQSLRNAQERVHRHFGYDLVSAVTPDEWNFACQSFQKRHLLSHKMGVVDAEYMTLAGDPDATIGRKITIRPDEATKLATILRRIGVALVEHLANTG